MENNSVLGQQLDLVDMTFTLLFTAELCINAYGHWLRPFFGHVVNILDLVVVMMSLFALVSQNSSTAQTRVIRVVYKILRTVRVLKIFDALESSKKIILALSASIGPVANAFSIMIVVTTICE